MQIVLLLLLLISTVATACHPGWLSNGGSCYLFAQINLDYLTAKDYCIEQSAHLVHINDATENTFLKKTALSYDAKAWWIGLSDMEVEGTFKWGDDDSIPTFTDWHPGQPNDYRTNEDCADLYKGYNFTWADYNCVSQAGHPICESADTTTG